MRTVGSVVVVVTAPGHRIAEGVRAVAGAVVGHDALDRRDFMLRESGSGAIEERDGRDGFLIGQRFGVREQGVAVDS